MRSGSDNLHHHRPLNRSKRSIRLIKVSSELSKDGRIQCTIRHTTIAANYYCLSYTWGSAEGIRLIELNGAGFPIRANLWHFLNAARETYSDKEFWIDAICIDQDSIAERNHQVQQMDRIYMNAQVVVIWLPDPNGDRSLALNFLHTNRANRLPPIICGRDRRLARKNTVGPVSDALIDLCEDEFWNRTWVIQEVILARTLVLMSGHARIPFTDLETLLLYKPSISGTLRVWLDSFSPKAQHRLKESRARLFTQERTQRKDRPHEYSIQVIVKIFGKSHCSDIRDRVFGLLALTDHGADSGFKVDYTMTRYQIFSYQMRCCTRNQLSYARTLVNTLELEVPVLLEAENEMTLSGPTTTVQKILTAINNAKDGLEELSEILLSETCCSACGCPLTTIAIAGRCYDITSYAGLLPHTVTREVPIWKRDLMFFPREYEEMVASETCADGIIFCLRGQAVPEHLLYRQDGRFVGFVSHKKDELFSVTVHELAQRASCLQASREERNASTLGPTSSWIRADTRGLIYLMSRGSAFWTDITDGSIAGSPAEAKERQRRKEAELLKILATGQ